MKHDKYVQRHGLKKLSSVLGVRPKAIDKVTWPVGSHLHFPVYSQTELGILPHHISIANSSRVYVRFEETMQIVKGDARHKRFNSDREVKAYLRKHRNFSPVKDLERSLAMPSATVVTNYGILPRSYTFTRSAWSSYNAWYNYCNATIANMKPVDGSDVSHHLILDLPDVLPTLKQLRKYENGKIASSEIMEFSDPSKLFIYELWKWLGENSVDSMFFQLDPSLLRNVHLFANKDASWLSAELNVFWDGRETTEREIAMGLLEHKGLAPKEVQLRLYRFFMNFYDGMSLDEGVDETEGKSEPESMDGNPEETTGDLPSVSVDDDDEDILVAGDVDAFDQLNETDVLETEGSNDPKEALIEVANQLAAQGRLSVDQVKRAEKLAADFENIDNPFGEGKLKDAIVVRPEDVKVVPKKYLDDDRVADKRQLESSLDDMDDRYITKTLKKEILANIVAIQKGGIMVKDIKVKPNVNIMNDAMDISVQVEVLGGGTTTLQIKNFPNIRKDGSFYMNGSRQRRRKQRIDKPIRKVGPSRVSLTSVGYGKVSVSRVEKVSADYSVWLSRHINTILLDDSDGRVTASTPAGAIDRTIVVPRPYSALAENYGSLKIQGKEWIFSTAKTADVKPLKKGYIPLTMDGTVQMDPSGYIWKNGEEWGLVHDILGLKNPVREHTVIRLFDKYVPIGMMLAYRKGLTGLIKSLDVPYRITPAGGRMDLQAHEIPIRFEDRTLIVDITNREHELVFAGFNAHAAQIKRFLMSDFDKTAAFQIVLESAGIGARYLREIDHLYRFFVDPITERNLVTINEPTTVDGLIRRSIELLVTDDHTKETAMDQQRIRGYEAYASEIYGEITKAARMMEGKGRTRHSKLELDPFAVSRNIQEDPALILVQESNPLHNLKEREMVTFNGRGGRSTRTMEGDTRAFHEEDMGIISEAGKDDGGVGVNIFASTNASFTDVYGNTRKITKEELEDASKFYSAVGLVSPFIDTDDKRYLNSNVRLMSNCQVSTL